MVYKIIVTVLAIIFLFAAMFFGYKYFAASEALRAAGNDIKGWIAKCLDYIRFIDEYKSIINRSETTIDGIKEQNRIIGNRSNQLEKQLREALEINRELATIIKAEAVNNSNTNTGGNNNNNY